MKQKLEQLLKWLPSIILGLLFVALGLRAVSQAAVFPSDLTDFTVYLTAARALARGHDPYTVVSSRGWHFTSPLAAAVAFAPLTRLPTGVGAALWYLFSLGCLAGTMLLAIGLLVPEGRMIPRRVWVIPMVVLAGPIIVTLSRGQWFLLIAFLITLGWWCSVHEHEWLSGICFGAAAALKLLPMIFLLYLLGRRRRAALGGFVISMAVLAVLLPGMFVRWNQIPKLYEEWYSAVVSPALSGARTELYGELLNPALKRDQSVEAVVYRIAGSALPIATDRAVRIGAFVLNGLLLLSSAFVLFRNRIDSSATAEAARVGLVTCLMLFVSPVTWSHYHVVLILPIVLMASSATMPLRSDTAGRILIAMIAVSVLGELSATLQVYGALLLNGFIVFAACWYSLWRARESSTLRHASDQWPNGYPGSEGRFPSIVKTVTESSCQPVDGRNPIASGSAATR